MSQDTSSNNFFPKCEISHCKLLSLARKGGLCSPHYQRKYRGLDPEAYSTAHLKPKQCDQDRCLGQAVTRGMCASHASGLVKRERKQICLVNDCKKTVSAKGLCQTHYVRTAPSSTFKDVGVSRKGSCQAPGCSLPRHLKGLCKWHHAQSELEIEFTTVPQTGYLVCSFPGCGRRSAKHQLCKRHRDQIDRGEELSIIRPKDWVEKVPNPPCAFVGCELISMSSGPLCPKHHNRARTHGLTPEELLDLFADPRCASCGADSLLVIDHDHSCCPGGRKKACGKCVRGLLCGSCNTALGLLQESISRIESLARYAEKHSAQMAS